MAKSTYIPQQVIHYLLASTFGQPKLSLATCAVALMSINIDLAYLCPLVQNYYLHFTLLHPISTLYSLYIYALISLSVFLLVTHDKTESFTSELYWQWFIHMCILNDNNFFVYELYSHKGHTKCHVNKEYWHMVKCVYVYDTGNVWNADLTLERLGIVWNVWLV